MLKKIWLGSLMLLLSFLMIDCDPVSPKEHSFEKSPFERASYSIFESGRKIEGHLIFEKVSAFKGNGWANIREDITFRVDPSLLPNETTVSGIALAYEDCGVYCALKNVTIFLHSTTKILEWQPRASAIKVKARKNDRRKKPHAANTATDHTSKTINFFFKSSKRAFLL